MPGQQSRIRRSKQRDRILSIVEASKDHPTASDVYEQVKEEFPSASLGNVYRNLNILVDQGLVRRLAYGSTFDRFEAAHEPHAHFVCRICGEMYDVSAPETNHYTSAVQHQQGHSVEQIRIQLEGVCASCAANAH